MGKITVVKIGGNVVDNRDALEQFVKDFAAMPGHKILVHGGGKEATRMAAAMDVPTKMIEGRRVTSREMLDVVTMVYAGLINKRIVAMLQQAGCNALGLCGADGKAISAVKRSPVPIDYGYVGDIPSDGVNANVLDTLLSAGIVPVVCAITYDGEGGLLNSNADGVASAVALGASRIMPTHLVYCFEKAGVLADVNDESSLIGHINRENFIALKEQGIIADGMIPKIDNALKAVDKGVSSVIIKSASNLNNSIGTTICE